MKCIRILPPFSFYIYYFISIQISYGRFLVILSGSLRGKISCLPYIFCISGMVALCAAPSRRTVSGNYNYTCTKVSFSFFKVDRKKLCTNFHRKQTEMSTIYSEQKYYLCSRSASLQEQMFLWISSEPLTNITMKESSILWVSCKEAVMKCKCRTSSILSSL